MTADTGSDEQPWDCLIVGGGPAGLSAALVLGRARRQVLLVDAGHQANLPASTVGGLLGQPDVSPSDLLRTGAEQLDELPSVTLMSGHVEAVEATGDLFSAQIHARPYRYFSRRVLLASGIAYTPPKIEGLAPLWGGDVFHCPFCHGWEVAGLPLGVIASDPESAEHTSLLLASWSDDIVLFTDGSELPARLRERLRGAGVAVEPGELTRLRSRNGRLHAVELVDGRSLRRSGLLVAADRHVPAGIADAHELARGPKGTVTVDEWWRTSRPGIYAAGDLTTLRPQVASAIAAGSEAAAGIHFDLIAEHHELTFPPG